MNSVLAKRTIATAILIIFSLLCLLPLYFMLVGSIQETTGSSLLNFIPRSLTLVHFESIFSSSRMMRYVFNSVIVSVSVVTGNLIFSTMVGYGFARYRFKGKELWFASALAVMMIPPHVIIIPLYKLISTLGWYDSYAALIVPWLVNPLGVFLMRQYISSLPVEIEDAARVDGASDLYIIFRIVMPLAKPALAVLAFQVFLTNWNWFLYPFILTSSDSMRTLPVALALLKGYQSINIPQLFAASTIAALPVIFLFLIFQKQIIAGITSGALKS
ncbi:MAG: ABC transporter permease subunit [candidate division Zixibacteria bacterium]|nr:ABC transporter permease subunit [candidate division Zixibacteria bacterium]